ncbi:MAG TPA: 16S rRNA (cytosine(1402)-N(4))-methyltransferase RsmH [Actinomycetes bacterium]|nr:16S rRNA (cytosine(1402)-N(4))-methyltransferase RsmH [Actinomycetes bacterium]
MSPPPLHVPVMLERVVGLLAPALEQPDAVMVDATLGMGGHSHSLLERFPELRVVGIDRDTSALSIAGERLAEFSARTSLVHAVYDEIPSVLADLGLGHVCGVLMDLGVSSLQLDREDRGFAYSYDAPLDMRMDSTQGQTAADVLNTYSVNELARVLRVYGEERFAHRIASAVAREREQEPFATSERLVTVIRAAVPAASQRTGGHPAKRTFQALRIEVNAELSSLERALPAAIEVLALSGRIVVMSYQSLEDRIVKRSFAKFLADDVPPDFPVPGSGPELRLLTRGAERPSDEEVADNPRATSARLRAAERVRVAA